MGSETSFSKIPKIDFRGLELSKAGTKAWDATRAKVMEAVNTDRFFTVVFDSVSDELMDEFFTSTLDSLYGAPLELKMKLSSDKPFRGYVPVVKGYSFESLNIMDPHRLDSVQAFTDHLFHQGNPKICDALWSYCKKSYDLELIITRMILEGLGVVEHLSSFVDSVLQEFRIQKFELPDNDTMVALNTHTDTNLFNILYQHDYQGLEMLNQSGEWLFIPPKTYTVVIADIFEAWSNGWIKAVPHRVRMLSSGTRYSLAFGAYFNDGFMIEAPKELVTDKHPRLYTPFDYLSYMIFYASGEGVIKTKETLKAYCGVNVNETEA